MKNERRSVVLYRAPYIHAHNNMYFAHAFKDGVHVPHIKIVFCDGEFPLLEFPILSRP